MRHGNLSRARRWRPGRGRRVHGRGGRGSGGSLSLGRVSLLVVSLLLILGPGALRLAVLPVALGANRVATLPRRITLVRRLDGRATLTHGVVPAVAPGPRTVGCPQLLLAGGRQPQVAQVLGQLGAAEVSRRIRGFARRVSRRPGENPLGNTRGRAMRGRGRGTVRRAGWKQRGARAAAVVGRHRRQ